MAGWLERCLERSSDVRVTATAPQRPPQSLSLGQPHRRETHASRHDRTLSRRVHPYWRDARSAQERMGWDGMAGDCGFRLHANPAVQAVTSVAGVMCELGELTQEIGQHFWVAVAPELLCLRPGARNRAQLVGCLLSQYLL